jgi:hypothetical protein
MVPRWLLLAALSAVAYGISSSCTFTLTSKHKISPTALAVSAHALGALLFGLLLLVQLPLGLSKNASRDTRAVFGDAAGWAILIGALFWCGDVALNTSYSLAPNPGYCDSLSDGEMVVTALLSAIFLGATLTLREMMGMALAIVSLYLVQT